VKSGHTRLTTRVSPELVDVSSRALMACDASEMCEWCVQKESRNAGATHKGCISTVTSGIYLWKF
jgi:hypothetical protein